LIVGIFLLATFFAGQAMAQEVVVKNVYYFMPPADGSGLLGAWGSEPIGHLGFHLGAVVDYEDQPLEWTDPEAATHILFYNQLGVQALVGFGILDKVNLSAAFTFTPMRQFNDQFKGKEPYQNYADANGNELKETPDSCEKPNCFIKTFYRKTDSQWQESAMGDTRVQAKYIFSNRQFDQYGLAFLVELGIPTGDPGQFVSDEDITISPRAIFDMGNTWWTFLFNVAYKYYPTTIARSRYFEIAGGNELILNTGVTFRFLRWGELLAEFQTRSLFEALYSNRSVDYGEAIFAFRGNWLTNNPIRMTVGIGVGILDGVGTPLYRAFVGFDAFIKQAGLPR
jgi:hypothetical protein